MDAVIAGLDRDAIGVLLFAGAGAGAEALPRIRELLRDHNTEYPNSSQRVSRALWMTEPPSIDAGEVTDKGYINQAAVLRRRAALVERMYRGEGDDVLTGL